MAENSEVKPKEWPKANEGIPEEFQAARIKLGRARPYIQRALWSVPVFMTEEAVVPGAATPTPTIGVDKWWRMYVHPEYVKLCTVDQLATTIYHEVAGHLLSNHADRADAHGVGLNTVIWNIAGDMAINANITREAKEVPQQGSATLKMEFPKDYGVLPKDAVKFGCPKPLPDDWTAEAYFDELCKHAKKVTVCTSCGSGADGQPKPYELPGGGTAKKGDKRDGSEGLSPAEQELVKQAVARDIVEHAKAKGRGTVPAHLLVWAEERFDPKVPWDKVLRSLIRRCLGAEVLGHQTPSFKRPSRRVASLRGVLLPTRWKPEPRVACIADTSGSMGCDKRLAKALTEIDALVVQQSAKVFFGACDAAATQLKRINAKQIAPELLVGGGGTDMRVGLDAMLDMKPPVHLMIVVSDGETPWPDAPTPIPLVIVLVGDEGARQGTPAWAHTVYVDE